MKHLLSYSPASTWCSALVLLLMALSTPLLAQTYSGNPILPAPAPDPDILLANGKYYIYPTGGRRFRAYSSTDLTNWVDEGVIFDLGTESPWANTDGWAPDVVYHNNQYYFYYTAQRRIGVAVGPSPTGPFTDKGSALIGTAERFYSGDAIDPEVFIDDDGQAYLYYTNYGGASDKRMITQRLQPDLISLQGSPTNTTPPNYTEASYMLKRNGTYYMMYSNNFYFKDANYNVQYSTSSSPTGPWTYGGQVLSGNADYLSPGHHAVLKMPGCDEYYIIYHRYDKDATIRATAIDRMYFSGDGSIQPVQMTSTGVISRPVNGPCQPDGPGGIAEGVYRLINQFDGKALTRAQQVYATNTQGNYVITYPYDDNDKKQWEITSVGDGNYKLINQFDGKALTRAQQVYATDNQGNYVITYPYTNNDKRHWKITPVGNGLYRLINQFDGKALTRAQQVYATNNQGNYAITYPYTDNDKRHWALELVESANTRQSTTTKRTVGALIKEETLPTEHLLYPNPIEGVVHINLPASQTATLRLYDRLGRLVLEGPLSAQQALDVTELSPGLYQASVQQAGKLTFQKVIVK